MDMEKEGSPNKKMKGKLQCSDVCFGFCQFFAAQAPDLDWRTRIPSPSRSRKASPTRALLQEFCTATPPISIVEEYEANLLKRVVGSIEFLSTDMGKDSNPIALNVNLIKSTP